MYNAAIFQVTSSLYFMANFMACNLAYDTNKFSEILVWLWRYFDNEASKVPFWGSFEAYFN